MCSVVCFAKWTIAYFPPGSGFSSLDQFRSQPATHTIAATNWIPGHSIISMDWKFVRKNRAERQSSATSCGVAEKVLLWNKRHYVAAHVAMRSDAERQAHHGECPRDELGDGQSNAALQYPLPNPRITIKLSCAARAALWAALRFIHHSVWVSPFAVGPSSGSVRSNRGLKKVEQIPKMVLCFASCKMPRVTVAVQQVP